MSDGAGAGPGQGLVELLAAGQCRMRRAVQRCTQLPHASRSGALYAALPAHSCNRPPAALTHLPPACGHCAGSGDEGAAGAGSDAESEEGTAALLEEDGAAAEQAQPPALDGQGTALLVKAEPQEAAAGPSGAAAAAAAGDGAGPSQPAAEAAADASDDEGGCKLLGCREGGTSSRKSSVIVTHLG